MSPNEANPNSVAPPGPPTPKRPSSMGVVALSLVLLGALVWAMAPGRARFAPAPLRPVPPGCPKTVPDFVPSDSTEVPGIDWHKYSAARRNHLLFRLNMEPCPCGCNSSVAACRISHPACPISKDVVEKMIAEERNPEVEGNSPQASAVK